MTVQLEMFLPLEAGSFVDWSCTDVVRQQKPPEAETNDLVIQCRAGSVNFISRLVACPATTYLSSSTGAVQTGPDRCSTNSGFALQPIKPHAQETSTSYRRLQASLSSVCDIGRYYLYYTGYQIFPLLQSITVSFLAIHCTNICKIMIRSKAISGSAYRRLKNERPIEDCLPTELTKQVRRLHSEEFCVRVFLSQSRNGGLERWLTSEEHRTGCSNRGPGSMANTHIVPHNHL